MQITAHNSLWKHGLSHKARSAHLRPESAVHVIGSAVDGSVTMDVRSTELDAVAAEFLPGTTTNRPRNSSLCEQFISGMTEINMGPRVSLGAYCL